MMKKLITITLMSFLMSATILTGCSKVDKTAKNYKAEEKVSEKTDGVITASGKDQNKTTTTEEVVNGTKLNPKECMHIHTYIRLGQNTDETKHEAVCVLCGTVLEEQDHTLTKKMVINSYQTARLCEKCGQYSEIKQMSFDKYGYCAEMNYTSVPYFCDKNNVKSIDDRVELDPNYNVDRLLKACKNSDHRNLLEKVLGLK